MPRSECKECGTSHNAGTQEKLREWEMKHHAKSWHKYEPGSLNEASMKSLGFGDGGQHSCSSFSVYDDYDNMLGYLVYAHGKYFTSGEARSGSLED